MAGDISLLLAYGLYNIYLSVTLTLLTLLYGAPNKFQSECNGVILFARHPNSKRAIYFSKVEKEKRFPLYSPAETCDQFNLLVLVGSGS